MSRIFYIGDPDVFSILDLGLKNAHLKIFNIESYTESFYRTFFQGLEFQANILRPFSDSCFRENTIYMSQER